jgi:hypothetical protein
MTQALATHQSANSRLQGITAIQNPNNKLGPNLLKRHACHLQGQPIYPCTNSNAFGLRFRGTAHGGSAWQEWVRVSDGVVAPVPWPGQYAERDIERHAVLAQGTRSVRCALGDACVDDGINQQGGDLVGSLTCRAMRLWGHNRQAIWAGNPEGLPAGSASAFDRTSIAGTGRQGTVEDFRSHFSILEYKTS